MIVTGFGCDHMEIFRPDNSADTPAPLVVWWNEWVAAEAAKRCAARSLSSDQAARWFDYLRPEQYAPAVVRR